MARFKLSSPDQPIPVRLMLRGYEALASLPLAVTLILTLAFVLAWATFVESDYGTEAVHFAIYDAWWFSSLLALLGVNVLCAALIRFPWRRYQTGFLITHAGILVLLVGCIYSARSGIDAQMPIFEGGTNHLAEENTRHFELRIYPDRPDDGAFSVIDVPFASGPFNWRDYEHLSPFPWGVGHRDAGSICDQNGLQLEVLDYCRDWTLKRVDPLTIRAAVSEPDSDELGPWQTVTLTLATPPIGQPDRPPVAGARKRLESGLRFSFWPASSWAATEAFRLARPEGDLGEKGQIVLYARGNVFRFSVDELEEGDRLPLGQTGYEAEFVGLSPPVLGAQVVLYPPSQESVDLLLLAESPEFSLQAVDHGVYGSYWVDAASELAANASETVPELDPNIPRIDVIQGHDGRLEYRVWQSPNLQPAERLLPGQRISVNLERSNRAARFYVESHEEHERPGARFAPVPFDKETPRSLKGALVRVRLTVDGNSEEFWLEAQPSLVLKGPDDGLQRRTVMGDDRRVEITLAPDTVDVGFHVYLEKFQRKLDPGTSTASHYSSLVDFVTVKADSETGEEVVDEEIESDVLITLNEPITRTDSDTGRSFRIYQESFQGPWKPGDGIYDSRLGGKILRGESSPRDELFLSTLTVNYDPGRGLKYLGCLMIVAGIATMFYMKAYFFARRGSGRSEAGQ